MSSGSIRSKARFTRGALRRRKWLFIPLVLMILPVAVTLNRFLAPLWVLSFCFVTGLRPFPFVLTLFGLQRTKMHRHRAPFHSGRLLDVSMRPKLLRQLIEQSPPDIRVSHLPPAKEDGQLHFVPAIQELGRLATLRFQIVIVDLRANPHLFKLDDMLILARLALLAALLVPELAVVHQAADRRHRVRRDFYKIQTSLTGHLQRVASRDHPDLLALFVNQPHLSDANALVNPGLDWSGYGWPP